jgi:hypothetical protein
VEVLSLHTIACEETVRHGTPARLVASADYAPAALARWAALAGVGCVCIEHFLLHPAVVECLRLGGLSVTTINDAALAARAAVLGVDAITTDRPAAPHHQLAATSQPAERRAEDAIAGRGQPAARSSARIRGWPSISSWSTTSTSRPTIRASRRRPSGEKPQ